VGPILVVAGLVLIVGIMSLKSVSTKIPERMMISTFDPVNYAFIVGGIGIALIGVYQFLQPKNQTSSRIRLE
jgi:hypothetical protein